MAMPWEGIVSADEIAAYEAAGFGRPQAQGKRPALLIIDVQYRTVGTQRQPFWESIKEFKTSCGEVGWNAVDHIAPLLALFREKNLPVLYPYVAPKENFDVGRLAEKVPALMGVAAHGYQFVPEVAPLPHDVLLPKKHPSAFFWHALGQLFDRSASRQLGGHRLHHQRMRARQRGRCLCLQLQMHRAHRVRLRSQCHQPCRQLV